MIPNNRFSSITRKGSLVNPWSRRPDLSRHWGPIAIQDPTSGLFVKIWQMRTPTDSGNLLLSSTNVAEYVWYTHAKRVTQVSLAFDQNGLPVVAYVDIDKSAFLRWFDSTVNQYVTVDITSYATTPRVTLDDARQFNLGNSDVILGYVRAGVVRYRIQRERFETEHTPTIGVGGATAKATALRHVSMNSNLRLEFLTDDAGDEPWPLAEVVSDLLQRSDIKDEHIDVDKLYDYTVQGYRIANEAGADANIMPLQIAWFFDPGEWDKRLRFIPRGGEPVAYISHEDFLERSSDDGAMQIERVQQAELLRKVNVSTVDRTAGWVVNKQSAERRSATIKAVGESSTALPITCDPDFAATIAAKRLRVPWAEPNKYKFSLGIPWSALTPTDVVVVTDAKGVQHRQRIGQIDEDYGAFSIEATSNGGWVYSQQATGVSAPPSIPTVPGQAGDTTPIIMDIPVLRDQNDELGYYLATEALGDGWNGGVIQISLDNGATILQTVEVADPSTTGRTVTSLLPEISNEYLSSQTLRITLSDPPESTSYADMLRYQNLASVQHADGSWELLQFSTVTAVDASTFDLSGLVRGRYNTKPLSVLADAKFVLIDESILFLQMQQWMIGQTVSYRGITSGQNIDDAPWQTMVISTPQTQMEWPVHSVRATRDASNTVVVNWVGRARLGVETNPYHSKYFGGYRVRFSDGHTADTMSQTYSRPSTPSGVTVTVTPLNTITGPGQSSTGVST